MVTACSAVKPCRHSAFSPVNTRLLGPWIVLIHTAGEVANPAGREDRSRLHSGASPAPAARVRTFPFILGPLRGLGLRVAGACRFSSALSVVVFVGGVASWVAEPHPVAAME